LANGATVVVQKYSYSKKVGHSGQVIDIDRITTTSADFAAKDDDAAVAILSKTFKEQKSLEKRTSFCRLVLRFFKLINLHGRRVLLEFVAIASAAHQALTANPGNI
jgi:hypothetical protein